MRRAAKWQAGDWRLTFFATAVAVAVGVAATMTPAAESIFDFGNKLDAPPTTQQAIAPRGQARAATAAPTPPVETVPRTPDAPPVIPLPDAPPVAPPAPTPSGRYRPPSADELAKAREAVRSANNGAIANTKTTPARRQLARQLIAADAAGAAPTSAMRYAYLLEAMDQAIAAADVPVALRAQEAILRAFDVDEYSTRQATVARIAPLVTASPLAAHAVAGEAIPLLEAALRDDDFDTAEQVAAVAEQAAIRAAPRDSLLIGQVAALTSALRSAKPQWLKAKPGLDAVAKTGAAAADPPAALDAGRYHCLVKRNWDAGLPLLAAGGDQALRAIAAMDVKGAAADPAGQLAIANEWWRFAASSDAAVRPRIMERAAYWYKQAAPALAGNERATAEQRAAQGAPAGPRLEGGLIGEVFWDPSLTHLLRVRVDPVVSADYAVAVPDPSIDAGVFGIRWTGMLKVTRAGKYTLVARVRDSVRIWIDGKRVMACARPSEGHRAPVTLTEGLHAIRIHYTGNGDHPRLNLGWSLEGGFGEQVIPAINFLHDPGAGAESLRSAAGADGGGGGGLMAFTNLTRTPRAGGAGGLWFDALPEETGGLLVGVRVAGTGRVKSIRPIFRSEAGKNEDGPVWFGRGGGGPTDLVAKDGYAVGGMTVKAGNRIDGLSVTFMRIKANGTLDPRDNYPSAWFGGTGGKELTLGGTGKPVIGLTGRSGLDLDALGLVMKK